MASTVMHNAGAQLSLGQLNKNITKAGKALARVSTGERIIGAQDDDSASFAISEKMREQIRSLLQDNQNVQNGSSMLKVAERGIDQIIQEIKTLKELAIDAANDSNTDEDRRTIQKEFDSRKDTINDIVFGSQYNGKILLDGTWSRKIAGGAAGTVDDSGAFINSATGMFNLPTTVMKKTGAMAWADDKTAYTGSANQFVPLDFSATKSSSGSLNLPDDMDQQGFSILCTASGCPSFYGFMFDTSLPAGSSEVRGTGNAPVYVVGIEGVTNAQDLSAALFEGVANAVGQSGQDTVTLSANHKVTLKKDGSGYSFTQDYSFYVYEGYGADYAQPKVDGNKNTSKFNPLWIQHGTQSGQRIHCYINSMQTKDLGLDGCEVTTRPKATSAIAVVESALEIALNEATNMGAYLQRLEYTDSNVTIMGENVTQAESTIRDADMAREMAEYTKYNIFTQSSQAMLAQANQNGSAILSLLQ